MELSGGPFSVFLLRKKTTWYSIKDGNWSDPTVWLSNKLDYKLITSPQKGDDVVINHNVTLDNNNITFENTSANQYTVFNLFINGKLIFGVSSVFAVTNNIRCPGTLDMSANNSHIYLQGQTNYINNLTNHATNSTVHYTGKLTQTIVPVTYCILDIVGKLPNTTSNILHYTYQTADITCYNFTFGNSLANTFGYSSGTQSNSIVNHFLNGYSITCNNNFLFQAYGNLINSINTGSFLVKGDITVGTSFCLFNFPTNYQIEVRGGIGNQTAQSGWSTQNALTIRYTTNNQTIAVGGNVWAGSSQNQFNHLIDGITVTVTNTGGTPTHTVITTGWIDGTNGSSILINKGSIAYDNTQIPFVTAGSMDCSTFSNYFGYISSSAQNIYSTNYYNLYINGAGTKKLLQDTTCQTFTTGNNLTNGLNIGNIASTLDTNGFNLTINSTLSTGQGSGTANVVISNNSIIIKGGIVFALSSGLSVTGTAVLEMQGGGVSSNTASIAFNVFISTAVKFTTANQNISSTGSPIRFDGTVLIDTGITVTTVNSTGGYVQFNNTLNGVSGTATLLNNSTDTRYATATQPMATGVLDCSTTVGNVFNYNLNGNQDLTLGTYKNLTLSIGGAKKLLGNISVINTYTLSAPATLNSNGFSLTNP